MAISFNKALGLYESALKLRSDKASTIASNLANADTPNYKAKDINFHEALKSSMGSGNNSMSMRTTHSGHIDFDKGNGPSANEYFRTPSQPSVDGNTVEEQVEHAEFMKNNLEFQAAFTMLNSRFKGMSKAVKGE